MAKVKKTKGDPEKTSDENQDENGEAARGSYWYRFQKGREKTGGRTKGTPNKTTARVAEALQNVYEEIGGDEALAEYAKDDPAGFFKLYAKMLPQHIKADITMTDDKVKAIQAGRDRVAGKAKSKGDKGGSSKSDK